MVSWEKEVRFIMFADFPGINNSTVGWGAGNAKLPRDIIKQSAQHCRAERWEEEPNSTVHADPPRNVLGQEQRASRELLCERKAEWVW